MNLGRTLPGRKDRSVRIRLPLPFWGWRSGRSPRGENAGVLYSLGFVALLIVGFSVYVGANILDDRGNQVERVATPASVPNPKEMERAAQQEADYLAHAMQAAAQTQTQKEPQNKEAAPQAQAPQPQQVVAEPQPAAAVPTDTTMYLTIPKIGLYDIPV